MWRFFQVQYKDMQSTQRKENSNVFTIYKESLLCENSTYKYDLHNKINMQIAIIAWVFVSVKKNMLQNKITICNTFASLVWWKIEVL